MIPSCPPLAAICANSAADNGIVLDISFNPLANLVASFVPFLKSTTFVTSAIALSKSIATLTGAASVSPSPIVSIIFDLKCALLAKKLW